MTLYMIVTTITSNIIRCDGYYKSVTHITITIMSYDTQKENIIHLLEVNHTY